MNEEFIKELNSLIKQFQECGDDYQKNVGLSTKNIDDRYKVLLEQTIPSKIMSKCPVGFVVKGSIGKGRLTSCPWLAIMNYRETNSTQKGVYIVFLFSSNLKHVYIALGQGVTKLKPREIPVNREKLRKRLNLQNDILRHDNNLKISGDKYNESAIYAVEWKCDDNVFGKKVLDEYLRAYDIYMQLKSGKPDIKNPKQLTMDYSLPSIKRFSIAEIIKQIKDTGLIYSDNLVRRFAFSLMTKPFVILSGLAGSGKTQLALAFAEALVKDKKKQMCVVSVGADWTNREPLLGFPNALQSGQYVKPESGVLDLLIEANKPENAEIPFFLILDEMNMSYVERYFADFLSAMESHEIIKLWDNEKGDVPNSVSLPKNLFIIGTINVDETTYMFSPKVLDRANVIEFKISEKEMDTFLGEMKETNRADIIGKAADMASSFVELASKKDLANDSDIANTLKSFFNELKAVNAEFGYRSATEIFRFICQAKANDQETGSKKMTKDEILDAAIVQKLLPKLHGSRKKLEPVLQKLWKLCFDDNIKDIQNITPDNAEKAKYKESADKIRRMYDSANANGFTSFAEA